MDGANGGVKREAGGGRLHRFLVSITVVMRPRGMSVSFFGGSSLRDEIGQ